VAAQVADGLEAIHAAGVVHRDVKPPNIMLDVEGRVRLMDFGIAKRLAGAGDPSTSYVVGSPEYMSPEQGRGRRVDARSDIYSLGIVLFELLTGRVPFLGDSPVATLLMHVEQPPPLQAPQLSQVPESLRGILRRSLAKDPEARFPSAREMGVALRRASGGGAATASGQGRAGRPPERRRVLLAALAALGLAVVAVRWAGGPQPPRDDRAAAASDARSPVVTAPPDVPSQRTPERPAERDIARPRLPVAQSPTPRPAPAQPPSASVPSEAARRPVEETSLATPAPSPPPSTAASGPAASPASPAPLASPPAAQPERTVSTAEPGMLVVAVSPWADVAVDGAHVGQTPLRAIALPPGPHSVLLTHPDFQPYPRRVTIRPGETVRLLVDLRTDGVRKRPR
jgi:serine/threonine-protein kinase